MSYEVDTVTNWNLDYEQLPGCRLNQSALRFFAVHPDKQWYFIGKPLLTAKLVLTGTEVVLTDEVNNYPAPGKASTGLVFTSRKT